jgi:CheY-like chemotaxis protein
MKILIIDDKEKYAKKLLEIFAEDGEIYSSGACDLNALATAIKEKINKNNEVVVFINVNLKTGENTRQLQKGVELLIWLRLKGALNHVVLYSFESLHSLLNRKQNHFIATSKGTSFVNLPNDYSRIKELLNKKKLEYKYEVENENLTITLRAAFNNTGLQHRLANIYGLWFMFNTHNNYFPQEKLDNSIFSREFFQSFDILQLHIANYLINKIDNKNSIQELLEKVSHLRDNIKLRKPKILYIDDKADIGWAAFLRKMIYGNDSHNNFQCIVPQKSFFDNVTSFETFFDDVKLKIINNNNPVDCVLLDLRLADETGDIDDLNDLSGIRLLKRIHQTFPALPVVMFTASNKANSVKKIIACGAEGLWTKPGLDDLKHNQFYLECYHELLTYLNDALNKYVTPTERFIAVAQFQVEAIEESTSYPNEIAGIDIILTDTNFWCNQHKELVDNHKSAKKLLCLAKGVERKRFIVIGDVFDELFRITQKKNTDLVQDGEIDNIPVKISAKYGLDVLSKYRNYKYIETDYAAIKSVIDASTDFVLKAGKNGNGFYVVSVAEKNHSFHFKKEFAERELLQRKANGHGPLHADDTFQLVIPYYISKKNILFVTEDFGGKKRKGGVPAVVNALRLKFGYTKFGNIPENFDKQTTMLKFEANGHYCLIAHSKVLHKICFPDNKNEISVISIPNNY